MSGLSLRARLLMTLVCLLGFGMLMLGAVQYTAMKSHLLHKVDSQLAVIGKGAEEHVLDTPTGQVPNFGEGTSADAQLAQSGALASYLQVRDGRNKIVVELTASSADDAPILPRALPLRGHDVVYFYAASDRYRDGERDWRVRARRMPDGRGYVVLAQPMRDAHGTLRTLRDISIGGGLLVVSVVGLMAWWLVRRGLRPLDHMGTTAEAIGAGELSRRVTTAGASTEVGRLGVAFNTMLGQLETAFRRREESEERLRRFVADASHELRTPLTSIRGYAEMFRRGASSDPDDLATAMRRIESESARMAVLVDELLLLARLDEGRPLASARLDVNALVADAVADARAADPERPISYEPGPPLYVDGDRVRLCQVLGNLLGNASRHTPPRTPVSVHAYAEDGSVRVEVADQGPGLTGEARARAFERFYRADESRARASGGSGLGLSIVESIVTAHGGRVGVDSVPGQGATFWFTLPVEGER